MSLAALIRDGRVRPCRPPTPSRCAFPFGLGRAGVHEVVEARYGDAPAATGFALAACAALKPHTVNWIADRQAQDAHGGLSQAGVRAYLGSAPSILFCEVSKAEHALWAAEEALRSGAAALTLVETTMASFTATRRLTLAAENYGAPLVLRLPHIGAGATGAAAGWRVEPRGSAPNPLDPRGLGPPRWRATLERARTAPDQAGSRFELDYDDATLSLTVVPELVAGSAAPGAATSPRGRQVG
ncbi:MAG: hypothetical protein ACFB2Z_05235 [Maricaulaceae bacterium]